MKRAIRSTFDSILNPEPEEWEFNYKVNSTIEASGEPDVCSICFSDDDFPKQFVDDGIVIVSNTEQIEEDLCIALERYVHHSGNYDVTCNICIPYDTVNDEVVSVGEATFEDILVSPY